MAKVTITHGCGCEREIETPGPEDPQGLLAKLAGKAKHRTPHPCPDHAAGAKPVRLAGHEHTKPVAETLAGGGQASGRRPRGRRRA